jgi:hypothetical protein
MSVDQVVNAVDVLTISNQRYLHCLLFINYYVATLPKGQDVELCEVVTVTVAAQRHKVGVWYDHNHTPRLSNKLLP